MTKIKSLYLVILLVSFFIPNQSNANFFENIKAEFDTLVIKQVQKKADRKYQGFAYPKAINRYEKLIEKGFSPDSVRRNLAVSYYKIHQTKKSEELLSELVRNNESNASDVYYYAQSLKYNKKYDEADKWIEKYRQLKQEDKRGELQYEAAPVINEIYSKEKYEIKPVYFNSEYSEFGAVVNGEQVHFASGRRDQAIIQYEYSWKGDPYLDLYSVSIEKPALYKDARLLTKGINSRFHDGPVCYSSDGSEIYITRSNFSYGMPKYSEKKENHFMLYQGRKKNDGWEDLIQLPFNSSEYSCGHPSISADNSTLYFSSDMPGGYGGSDIYYVERNDTGWSEPVNMGADINTEGEEMFPLIFENGILYFASNGHLGLGGLDIFMAEPMAKNSYGIVNMGYPLNSASDDFSFYLKQSDMSGYFASNREGGKGDDDIYEFTMLDKPTVSLQLIVSVKNGSSKEIISDVSVAITDSEGKEILKAKTNAQGQVETTVLPGALYKLAASKEKYVNTNKNVLADKNKAEDNVLKLDLLMNEINEWGVFGLIYEKESGNGVSDVEILITEKETGKEIRDITDTKGNFRKLLKQETDYDILLKKKKFFTRRGEFSTKDMKPGWIDVKEFIEVEMEEIVVGKTIEIPNIYYDVAKWDIRPDAAVELDKVVQFLHDNASITIELGSHTDARGSNSSNQTLSQKRAESAVNYIVTKGIATERISAKGYGETRLKNHCANGVSCSKEEHQANRRTEIMIVDF